MDAEGTGDLLQAREDYRAGLQANQGSPELSVLQFPRIGDRVPRVEHSVPNAQLVKALLQRICSCEGVKKAARGAYDLEKRRDFAPNPAKSEASSPTGS